VTGPVNRSVSCESRSFVGTERWESQAALETFRSSCPDTEQRRAMLTVSVQEYDIADVRPLFGKAAE
jgi:hypothetical protein